MERARQTGTSAGATAAAGRLAELDGLRAVAAAGVVLYHYDFSEGQYAEFGLLGVELFFIISGFVILMSLERARSLFHFAVTRAARLYPAYLFAVGFAACCLVLRGAEAGSSTDSRTILWNLTMLQRFFRQPDLIDPFWTLSYELWFYVAIGAVSFVGLLPRLERLALAWLAGMSSLRLAMLVFDRGRTVYSDELVQLFFMPQFGHLFIIGMMTRRLTAGTGDRSTPLVLLCAVLYSALGRDDWALVPPLPYLLAVSLFTYAVWGAATGRFRFFGWSPLVRVGDISYSLYLLHVPLGFAMIWAISPWFSAPWLPPLLALPLTVGLALLCRARIERPAQRSAAKYLAARSTRVLVEARPEVGTSS